MDNALRKARLACPEWPIDVVIDSDAFNEVDDQFALAYLLKNQDRLRVEAIYAAPFFNDTVASPKEGMEKSYDEILHILTLAGETMLRDKVYHGADRFMADHETPVRSEAVNDLICRGMAHSSEKPLYVVGIAAATNLASALLLEPALTERIVVVWLGGSAYHCADLEEFNLIEDVYGAQALFSSGVPLIQVPCWGVAEYLTVSKPELEQYLLHGDPLQQYLASHAIEVVDGWYPGRLWADPLWDVAAVAWLLNEDDRFMLSRIVPTPIPLRAGYEYPTNQREMGYVYRIHRDALITDLFTKLQGGAEK